MTQWLIVVTDLTGAFLDSLLKTQRARADGYSITILQFPFRLWLAVDKDLVGAATEFSVDYGAIDDGELTVFGFYMRVVTRGAGIVDYDRIVRRARPTVAHALCGGNEYLLVSAAAGISDLKKGHD